MGCSSETPRFLYSVNELQEEEDGSTTGDIAAAAAASSYAFIGPPVELVPGQ